MLNKKTLTFLLIFSTLTIYSQYTLIPDSKFETFLINSGYDSGNIDGKVLTSNINTITKLDLNNVNINSLEGIEDFSSLTELNCQYNNLTSLDLSKNLSLFSLDCSFNKLTSLDLSKNTSLSILSISNNKISSLDLSKNVNLSILYCQYNNLTSLDLSKNLALSFLYCIYNKLTSINVTECIYLKDIYISNNLLNNIDITNCIDLTFLNCRENELTSLDVSKNNKLTNLSCSINHLTSLDITKNINLIFLSCDENEITNIDFTNNTLLEFIRCNNNKLENLDFTYNTNLSSIYCEYNQLKNIEISKNINLYHLNCNYNQLTSLDVSKNTLLLDLYCRDNQIISLDVSKNTDLLFLNCKNNQLTYLDLRTLSSNSWYNSNSDFSWTGNPKLTCIYVLNVANLSWYWALRKDATANYFDGKIPIFKSLTQTVCSKQNPTLKDIIVIGNNIKWFDSLIGGNELPETTFLTEGTTYYATSTAGNCESLRSQVTISLKEISSPIVISPQTLCNVNNPTLNNLEVTGNSIKLYDAMTGGTHLPNNTLLIDGTTYFVSQTQNGCESPRIPVLVNILNTTKPTATNLQIFCIEQNATINNIVISGQNIKWYDSQTEGNIIANTTNLINGINYYATQTINGCESDRVSITVNIQNTLAPSGNSIQNFCSTQNATLNEIQVSGTDLKWYSSTTSITLLPISTLLIDGSNYFATQTVNGCESPRLLITVKINQTPQIPITNNQTFCESEKATISSLVITGQNIKWYDALTAGNELSNTTLLQNNINYFASQTVNGCESDRIQINTTVIPSVLPTLTSPTQTFCVQQNTTINNLTITGQNIKWYDAQTGGNLIPNTTVLTNGTTYYASQTINGCESSRVSVKVNIQNTLAPTGNSTQSFCSTQNATLNEIEVSGTAIKWYATKTSTTPLATSTLLVNGTSYFATQTLNGCESIERLAVTVSLISTLNANNYAEMLCDELNDGSENVNLTDYNSKLIASTADVIFTYYSSALGAENENSSDKINSNYKLNLGSHTIYVRIDSNNGCHQIVTLELTLVAKPIIIITDIVPICENKLITVSAGNGADSYLWSNGATSQSTIINVEGNYSVTAIKNYPSVSCSSTKNFTVKNSQTAIIKNIEIKDWTTNENQIIVYTTETGDFEYSINGTNFQDSNVFSNLTSGDYTVSVRDKYGCGNAIQEVYLLMYPKFFTPNGDGYNDTWSIQNSAKENLVTKIFDRYGKLIIILYPNQTWDGTLNGKKMPSSDYWFVVTRANGKEYKGHFSLKR